MKISLGAGGVRFPGWLHVDADPQWQPDVVADLSQPLPFADDYADFLQSEDFIGQLSFAQAREHLRDCHRVLKRGGVLTTTSAATPACWNSGNVRSASRWSPTPWAS
jgi:predicted SAM-dependent methyltransferase